MHLLPKAEGKVGSKHNELNEPKLKYIIGMRKSLCNEDICQKNGALNLKYFNVKKGHYWSKRENELLAKGVLEFGPTKFNQIKEKYLGKWTETEIRLRICKLFRVYDLSCYEGQKYHNMDEIAVEAKRNKSEAKRQQAAKG